MAGLSRPILGYFGEIAHWFDVQAVRSLAASRPAWSLVLIGPLHTAAAGSLLELPNVHYLGRRPYQELPRYLAHFDVCLLPFRVSELTSATNPIKLYEYALPSSRLSKYQSLPRLVPFTCQLWLVVALPPERLSVCPPRRSRGDPFLRRNRGARPRAEARVAVAALHLRTCVTTDTFERVRRLLAGYLKIPAESVGEDSTLEELGLDSLGALELIFEIEEEFEVNVLDDRIPEFRTVRAVCDGIEALRSA